MRAVGRLGLQHWVLAGLAALLASRVRADDLVKVMSFNVRTSYASVDKTSTCSNWDGVRKSNVASQITSVGPDFVGTQETSAEQKAYLDGVLSGTYTSIGTSSGSYNGNADEYTSIWYKHTSWKVLSQGMIWLGPNPDAMSNSWGMKYYRTSTYGRFQHIATGKTVCVFNTHYEEPGYDEAQTHGTQIIMDRISSVCNAEDRFTVITGDFNALMSYPAIQLYFTNGWKEENSDPTFCGNMIGSGCGTKFDFTLHKTLSGVCLAKDEVLRTAFNGCYPSDHAVLLATFCIEGSCCTGDQAPTTTPTPTNSTSGSSNGTTNGTSTISTSSTTGSEASSQISLTMNGSVTNESGVQGTVTPASGDNASSTAPAGSSGPIEVSTQSSGSSAGAGTFMAVFGVVGVVAATMGAVLKKRHNLEALLGINKNSESPNPWFFRASDASALSPKQAGENNDRITNGSSIPRLSASVSEDNDDDTVPSDLSPVSNRPSKRGFSISNRSTRTFSLENRQSRGFSSPVPTLGAAGDDDNRPRVTSAASSIACMEPVDRGSSNVRFSSDRFSSAIIMDHDSESNHEFRGSSRVYFGDLSII